MDKKWTKESIERAMVERLVYDELCDEGKVYELAEELYLAKIDNSRKQIEAVQDTISNHYEKSLAEFSAKYPERSVKAFRYVYYDILLAEGLEIAAEKYGG